ncbi:DnaD domain-containing protein [Chloroflexota bacterium]
MKQFSGFPAKAQFTPIPNVFFSSLLPQISDIAELRITLHIFWSLYGKRGYPRFTTYRELLSNKSLISSFGGKEKLSDEVLRGALEMAVKRGIILHLVLAMDGAPEDVYFINTESDKRAVSKIQNGELSIAGLKGGGQTYIDDESEPLPDIFTLYEQNIGMLTPMIADELREAEKLYPQAWIRDAIKEAVTHGKRKWSYISAILERWSTEGKSDGTYRRDFKKTDPDKYIKGKYGHMVRR